MANLKEAYRKFRPLKINRNNHNLQRCGSGGTESLAALPFGTTEIIMPVKLGFHLRVVARFVRYAQQFKSSISIRRGKLEADGKSVMGLLVLGAAWKSRLHIEAKGFDAKQAIEGIETFFRTETALTKAV